MLYFELMIHPKCLLCSLFLLWYECSFLALENILSRKVGIVRFGIWKQSKFQHRKRSKCMVLRANLRHTTLIKSCLMLVVYDFGACS
ncbi:hypothetical protein EUGRSUZ_H00171 [Eucalyptus grandis]|uniref:Uncharacterized protein n=2 Tax=Eucalyptus grandis TaxID=71139 RepID=A0ACC3JML0_EUCGR|nr:hypothetical protein EUGRSUZ_H00171 [Eucalyptus grandis]